MEEVESALRRLKKDKSGGIDGLQPEHLKFGGPVFMMWLKKNSNAFIVLFHLLSSSPSTRVKVKNLLPLTVSEVYITMICNFESL